MKKFKGIAASDGIAIEKAFLLAEPDLSFTTYTVNNSDVEIERLNKAIQLSKDELFTIYQRTQKDLGRHAAEVFSAHIEILSDPEFFEQVTQLISKKQINAEAALDAITKKYIETFNALTDSYMKQRADDVNDVIKRVMSHLLGVTLNDPALVDRKVIIIAHELTPSVTAQFVPQLVKGIVSDLGGKTSHSAIMSRTLEIPSVVGLENIIENVQNGDVVIVDGLTGDVIVDPDNDQIEMYRAKQEEYQQQRKALAKLAAKDTMSNDGKKTLLAANISSDSEVEFAIQHGAEGIGLFRTEFLYMKTDKLPTEEEQFDIYKHVLDLMGDRPVTIRTADIGGDKPVPYLKAPKQDNPFLGYRAIRLSLDREDIFRTQLRALIRASAFGKLSIMFPMIATIEEFRQAKTVFNEELAKVQADKLPVGDIKLGIMVEVPATVILADQFASEVDFMSIGTNDLIQYTMAADRGNEKVAYLYQPYNPAVLRMIKMVIEACHNNSILACMCGEMAGDQLAIPILLGMGLDEYSMSSRQILPSRSLISTLDSDKMVALANRTLSFYSTSNDVIKDVKRTLYDDYENTYK
ncbi:phosphoenolpyruvate--protein phosphotransferase [Lentilactobacillus kosonis]|uniref:Phosphoenolpyruvate-protein phosphotransferase n=1 Tax=Lentilactobacillus kosonis TaxID=2810561 RepID=A0A401FQ05_9LACO|nr:phosphoenolpyruvate--protein phosphotransferase [Lentilactobacillus kosonis]GAY74378.1 phosphoenolpyruvate-protein phosphotransferase of PTS system [Lentilactobacillus kosonis]